MKIIFVLGSDCSYGFQYRQCSYSVEKTKKEERLLHFVYISWYILIIALRKRKVSKAKTQTRK